MHRLALLLLSCLLPLLAQAAAEPRPWLVYLKLADCPQCEHFERQVLSHAEVQKRLADEFQLVTHQSGQSRVSLPDGRQVEEQTFLQTLRIYGAPALVYFNAGGEVVLVRQGEQNRQTFLQALDYVVAAAYEDLPFAQWQRLQP